MSKKSSNSKKDTQEDFWDLGDDELDLTESGDQAGEDNIEDVAETSEEPEEPAAEDESNEEDIAETDSEPAAEDESVEEDDWDDSSEEESKPKKAKEAPHKIKSAESTLDELGDLEDDEDEDEVEEDDDLEPGEEEADNQKPEQPGPAPQPQPKLVRVGKGKREAKPVSTFEKVSLALTIALLIGVFAWGISIFYRDAPEGELVTFDEDFPIQGENATIESVDTWWRKPVRSGDNPDLGVVIDINLIPCARIKISGEGSTTLQISFRDGEENLIGDTINLVVNGGKFERSGSDEVVVNSTSGFTNPSRLNAYANEDVAPWSLSITESGSAGSDSGPIVKARISASTQEK